MGKDFFLRFKEPLLACCIYLLLWGGLAACTQYIPSGLHFQEDHEVINAVKSFEEIGFWKTTYNEMEFDLKARFRPLYLAYRYVGFYLFGLQFTYWHILFFILLIGLSLFMFRVGRLLGLSFFLALALPLMIMTGSVTESITRLGTSELWGAFFSSAALYLIITAVKEKRENFLYDVCAHICVFIACGFKEAFIILIPVFIGVKLFSEYNFNKISIKEAIKRNVPFIAGETAVLLFCVYIIKFHFSRQHESLYAGFDGDIANALSIINNTLLSGLSVDGIIGGTGIYLLYIMIGFTVLLVWRRAFTIKSEVQVVLFYTAFFIYLWITQYLIHYKIVLEGHYLLPYMFGPAIVICLLAGLISVRFGKKAKMFCYSLVCLLLVIKGWQSYTQTEIYSDEGKANKELIQLVTDNTKSNFTILISGDELLHMEHFSALLKYFNYFSGGRSKGVLQLLPADEKLFLKIAGTNDTALIPAFKNIVHEHFKNNLCDSLKSILDYDKILVLSYCDVRFSKINKVTELVPVYNKKVIGKDWYTYTLYTKPD
jgi:hypothetical protein